MQKEKPCILNEYKVFFLGAADGSRTHLSSLGSSHSTDELQPRKGNDARVTCVILGWSE